MDKTTKVPCKYGKNCYQKNPTHKEKYSHPSKDDPEKPVNDDEIGTQDDCIGPNASQTAKKRPSDDIEDNHQKRQKIENEAFQSTSDQKHEVNDDPNTTSNESVPEKYEQFIEKAFLFKSPPDFYKFWEYCSTLNAQNPENAFKDVNLQLVGPYEVLSGSIQSNSENETKKLYLHRRFYYDPPEFQTVLIITSNKNAGHYGYFRDSIDSKPFLCYNSATSWKLSIEGDNIFAAVFNYLNDFTKKTSPFLKAKVKKMANDLEAYAKNLEFNLEKVSKSVKSRNNRVVAKTFNTVGIVVPVWDKLKIGYRPLSMDNKTLLECLTRVVENADDESIKNSFLAKIQPVITFANIAVDEGDFGAALEFAVDLFCIGHQVLANTTLNMFRSGYGKLNRNQLLLIVEEHLKLRNEDTKQIALNML